MCQFSLSLVIYEAKSTVKSTRSTKMNKFKQTVKRSPDSPRLLNPQSLLSCCFLSCSSFYTHRRSAFLFWTAFPKAAMNSGRGCRSAAFSYTESVTFFHATRRPLPLFWHLLRKAGVTMPHPLSSSASVLIRVRRLCVQSGNRELAWILCVSTCKDTTLRWAEHTVCASFKWELGTCFVDRVELCSLYVGALWRCICAKGKTAALCGWCPQTLRVTVGGLRWPCTWREGKK